MSVQTAQRTARNVLFESAPTHHRLAAEHAVEHQVVLFSHGRLGVASSPRDGQARVNTPKKNEKKNDRFALPTAGIYPTDWAK